MNSDVVVVQLRASAASCEAALLNAQLALAMYEGTAGASAIALEDGGLDTTDCPHLQREDASTMNAEGLTRDYCAGCRSYIYPDGRTEAAE